MKAEAISETIRNLEIKVDSGDLLQLSVSIGIATVTAETDTPDALFRDADKALYESKRKGRGLVSVSPGIFIKANKACETL